MRLGRLTTDTNYGPTMVRNVGGFNDWYSKTRMSFQAKRQNRHKYEPDRDSGDNLEEVLMHNS